MKALELNSPARNPVYVIRYCSQVFWCHLRKYVPVLLLITLPSLLRQGILDLKCSVTIHAMACFGSQCDLATLFRLPVKDEAARELLQRPEAASGGSPSPARAPTRRRASSGRGGGAEEPGPGAEGEAEADPAAAQELAPAPAAAESKGRVHHLKLANTCD